MAALTGITKGFKTASAYLDHMEDMRRFKGLLLHNVYSLTLIALVGIMFSTFVTTSTYWVVFWGALLLHMLTDIYGDFLTLGHADNWLWVLPDSLIERWGRLGNRLVRVVLLWIAVIVFGFLLVSLRSAWQLTTGTNNSLYAQARLASGDLWLKYAPLLALASYLLWLLVICAAAVYKYSLELRQHDHSKLVPDHKSFDMLPLVVVWYLIDQTGGNNEQEIHSRSDRRRAGDCARNHHEGEASIPKEQSSTDFAFSQ